MHRKKSPALFDQQRLTGGEMHLRWSLAMRKAIVKQHV